METKKETSKSWTYLKISKMNTTTLCLLRFLDKNIFSDNLTVFCQKWSVNSKVKISLRDNKEVIKLI